MTALFASLSGSAVAAQQGYLLRPGDDVAIRVLSWDTVEFELIEYSALNGTYGIGSDGTVMLPLLGPLPAAGRTTSDLAETVGLRAQDRLGLAEPPGASVEIVSYQPVYVLGAVADPGMFAFTPGLTVQQALALAGGLDAAPGEENGLVSGIRASGALRELSIDIARARIRAARLDAEIDGSDDFVAPEIDRYPGGRAAVEATIEQERSLFLSRRETQSRALAAIEDSKALLDTEISALMEKLEGQTRQISMLSDSVGNMESLVERGLARSPNFVALQSQLIDLENRQLDTETAITRARQSIAELERERLDIEARRMLEVLRELQGTEAEIERMSVRRLMTQQLLIGAEALLAEDDLLADLVTSFRITRNTGDSSEIIDADFATRLMPSDVVEVTISQSRGGG